MSTSPTDGVATARLEEQVKALFRLLDEKEKQQKIAFEAAQEAVRTALDAQRAVNMTQNEFRGSLNDQGRMMMPRTEAEQQIKALSEKYDKLEVRIAARENRGEGKGQVYALIGSVIATISAVIAVAVAVSAHFRN
jgi:hypothetical protein